MGLIFRKRHRRGGHGQATGLRGFGGAGGRSSFSTGFRPRGSSPCVIFNLSMLTKTLIMYNLVKMDKKYTIKDSDALRVEEMATVTATELKNTTADVLERLRSLGSVAITRHDKPRAVLLSMEQYAQLKGGGGSDWLGELQEEYRGVLEAMQKPEQKAAAERAFTATPEELGKAAVAAARGGYSSPPLWNENK